MTEYFTTNKLKIKNFWLDNILILTTANICIPIIIALLVNYSTNCKNTFYITSYNPNLSPCYFQSAITSQSILDAMLQYNYSAQITDTNTLITVPAFYVNFGALGVYYDFIEFVGYASTFVHIINIPIYILIYILIYIPSSNSLQCLYCCVSCQTFCN